MSLMKAESFLIKLVYFNLHTIVEGEDKGGDLDDYLIIVTAK